MYALWKNPKQKNMYVIIIILMIITTIYFNLFQDIYVCICMYLEEKRKMERGREKGVEEREKQVVFV